MRQVNLSSRQKRSWHTGKKKKKSVLNVQSTVAEDVLAGLVDHSQVDEPDSTKPQCISVLFTSPRHTPQ